MFETFWTLKVAIILMLLPLFFCWRMLKRKGHMSHFTALILKEIVMGVWHWLFGAKKVSVAKRREKKWWHFWNR